MITRRGIAAIVSGWLASFTAADPGAGPTLEPLAVLVAPDGDGFEIVAYASATQEVWATRTGAPRLTRIDVSAAHAPAIVGDVLLDRFGSEVTSVTVAHGMVAAAVLPHDPERVGSVVLLDTAGRVLGSHAAGFHPDMVCFAGNDGQLLLIANEGEPAGAFDPPGSLTVLKLSDGGVVDRVELSIGAPAADPSSVRWTTPLADTPPELVEPEYIAIDEAAQIAVVSCQENNGFARVDLSVWPPVVIDHVDFGVRAPAEVGSVDLLDDGALRIAPSSVAALPQPDGVSLARRDGAAILFTADEGDPRDEWGSDGAAEHGGIEQARLGTERGTPLVFGSRSVSAWTLDGVLVAAAPSPVAAWLTQHRDPRREVLLDRRSDRRGEEPEGLVHIETGGRLYVVVGFERIGAVGLFEFADDAMWALDMVFLDEIDRSVPSPEGLAVISLTGEAPIVAVADEATGTLTLLQLQDTLSHR